MTTKPLLLASCLLLGACNESQEKPREVSQELQIIEQPSRSPQDFGISNTQPTAEPSTPVQQPTEPVKAAPVAPVHISKEYEEGYDAGYEDGEDDAICRNGYGGQYDESTRYKGQRRKDYQLGYDEGYEAGFYDNVSDNGDDEEYE